MAPFLPAPVSPLSPRERERLGISLGTVRVYRRRMAEKLGHRAVGPMMLVAWRRGELDLDKIAEDLERARPVPGDPGRGAS